MKPRYELFEKIGPYIKDKEVLDIGCVDHKLEKSESPLWVHAFLKSHSKNVVGIDILEKEVKNLKERSYNVVYGDAENFNLDKKFDIVFAG